MNYLAKNLNNSLIIPYDVMKLIYEYADTLIYIKKQIENKEYDLDELMYERMKKSITKYPFRYNDDIIYDDDIINQLDKSKIIDIYKDYFFNSIYTREKCILNIPIHYPIDHKKYLMIYYLREANVYKYKRLNGDKYKMKNVYKKWLKL